MDFYKVEENRIINDMKKSGGDLPNLKAYRYIKEVEVYDVTASEPATKEMEAYFNTGNKVVDYKTLVFGDKVKIIKFEYENDNNSEQRKIWFTMNSLLLVTLLFLILIFVYIGRNIIKPFHSLRDLPEELSKGTLTKAIPESKNKFFGKFTWGLDLLRQKLETQKVKELKLEKEKKMLILSISHDIKTPLSAIKLYVKALKENLYDSADKKQEVIDNIGRNAEEIERFVGEIRKSTTTDFLQIEVKETQEYYLKELLDNIKSYYYETMKLKCIDFYVAAFDNCLLKGDLNRTIEVLQNILENAIKYGDGKEIVIEISEEEDCKLITVANSGNTLPDAELVHIFESFYLGSNVNYKQGNGLGLYICKEIMNHMNGEIFAESKAGWMRVTLVISR
jgi:signal transduction histidine kinase